ncbi:hydrogenase expression/formation protein [Marivita hallyeonensis]|uniref:Hydrogenase-1 operon protein HyaF n=1 Tax=Marivita hallyeonensis TaxID=996342 RepID=A0A1M5MJY8_9RHOB|nr:hydrogenase expression/formation protein [Marivita hallyeonensis]SHG77814.1 hydrogenase-1 operon protein HyaF [Marivita hallyeonensis]
MVQNFQMPPTGFGPGSQPEDETLDVMPMPQEMRTYSPRIPEAADASDAATMRLLDEIADAASVCAETGAAQVFDLSGLSPKSRALVAEVMGEGEVSIRMRGIPAIAAQESVFAGVWVLKGEGIDRIEVAPVPTLALDRAFAPVRAGQGKKTPELPGLASAPALIVELLDKSGAFVPGQDPHVINLTLLPHSEPDLVWLDSALGEGSVTILSRGYGNCRITATATKGIWRVQFFNSMDTLILDTFEVTSIPEVAIAADEDLADSALRIRAVMEAIA